jgi:hypothetical protein
MPNYKVFNNIEHPLYTQSVTIGDASANSQSGRLYTINTSAQTIVAGYFVVQLTNPASSGRTVYIDKIFGGSTGTINLSVFRNATFTASGTAMTPRNNNWSYSDSSVCTAKFTSSVTDPTSGGTLLEGLYQSSGDFLMEYQGSLIIPPSASDRQLYVRIQAALGLTTLVGITWWED